MTRPVLTLNPDRAAALLAAYRSPRNATRGSVPATTVDETTRPITVRRETEGRHREFPDPNKAGELPRWRHARRIPRRQRQAITAVVALVAILAAVVVAVAR